MQVKIFLHGHLKDKIGTDFVCTEAKTAYEAIKSITNRYRKKLKAPLSIGRWGVKLKDYDTKEKLMGRIRHNVLHLYPMFRTAKNVVQTIVDVVKVYAGLAVGYHIWGHKSYMETLSNLMAPDMSTSELEDTNSMYLGAGEQTTAAGTRIPFGYGKFKIAGHYISYNTSSTFYVAG